MRTNAEYDDRAAAALVVDAGVGWEEAKRYAAILRAAGVLRSGTDVKRFEVQQADGEPTFVDIRLVNGLRVAGDLVGHSWEGVWANPFLEEAGPS